MHLLHARGPLADGGRHLFDASAAHVTDRKNARPLFRMTAAAVQRSHAQAAGRPW